MDKITATILLSAFLLEKMPQKSFPDRESNPGHLGENQVS